MFPRLRCEAQVTVGMQERASGLDEFWKVSEVDENARGRTKDFVHLARHNWKGFGVHLAARSQDWACGASVDNAELEAVRVFLPHSELLDESAYCKVFIYPKMQLGRETKQSHILGVRRLRIRHGRAFVSFGIHWARDGDQVESGVVNRAGLRDRWVMGMQTKLWKLQLIFSRCCHSLLVR